MKQLTILLTTMIFMGSFSYAQKEKVQTKNLKQAIALKIDREGGANGASIAWHPVQKKYYAAMAGNETFPMEVFDANGKMLSDDKLETMFDVRGFWYNPTKKALQANSYDNGGWSEYVLNPKGIPSAARKLSIATTQPDAQSVGAYDSKKDMLYFWDFTNVSLEQHNMKDGAIEKTIELHPGVSNKSEISGASTDAKENYNQNAIIFTGIANSEIGMLNVVEHSIDLYSLASGLLTKTLKLPEDAPVESSLNFSYSNNTYWLFDKKDRIWHGYR